MSAAAFAVAAYITGLTIRTPEMAVTTKQGIYYHDVLEYDGLSQLFVHSISQALTRKNTHETEREAEQEETENGKKKAAESANIKASDSKIFLSASGVYMDRDYLGLSVCAAEKRHPCG